MLALLAGTFAAPSSAAPSPTVVYEVTRTPRAKPEAEVVVVNHVPGESFVMDALIVPEGHGYSYREASYVRWGEGGETSQEYELVPGARLLVAGSRGIRVRVTEKGWSVREVRLGFRIVPVTAADHTPVAAGVERYGHATAPAGPYGSIAYATVPCEPGAGTWTLTPDGEAATAYTCPVDLAWDFAEAERARRWALDADVVGVRSEDLRLVVLDYPKRSR